MVRYGFKILCVHEGIFKTGQAQITPRFQGLHELIRLMIVGVCAERGIFCQAADYSDCVGTRLLVVVQWPVGINHLLARSINPVGGHQPVAFISNEYTSEISLMDKYVCRLMCEN